MSDVPSLLKASLTPSTRKDAETRLEQLTTQPGFLPHLLGLCVDPSQDRAVRLAASVYLKNVAKLRWMEDVNPLPETDKETLRGQLVPAMLALPSPSDKAIRAQIAESVSLIAELDFPERWTNLIDQLVNSLSASDYNINIGVLETAHSIFRPWRSAMRSNELFTTINLVLNKFMVPYLSLLQRTTEALFTTPTELAAQAEVLLIQLFYDLTCQDLPPAIEDANEQFFAPNMGLFHRFLAWDNEQLRGDPDDTRPSVLSQIKTSIFEVAELFSNLYPDELAKTPSVEAFIQDVWNLIGSNKLPGTADDALVSQALRFVSTAIRTGNNRQIFSSKETIAGLVQGVVVPNVSLRESDIEQFEDDPLEFIRLDLALPSSGAASADVATRRQSAADVLQALVGSGHETETTEIVGSWISTGLQEYASNPAQGWKAKDTAIYLLTAVATRGSTAAHGVTATNALVDVVKFFSDNVFQDLQAASGSVHPILQVDAIRFLYTFRNQLTKEQLLSVLPLLVSHLGSGNYVTYTYAAITIERILFIKRNGVLLFSQGDIQSTAVDILNALLTKIEAAGSAEKISENDHLMKCVMRVLVTGRQTFTPVYQAVLQRLVNILGIVSKNPSNPNFDQYTFESIAALLRFVVNSTPSTLPVFEQALFTPFTFILQQDLDQYIPYVFQILAQMLELHTTEVPSEYRSLLPFLLNPAVWQQKGSIPGLVRLLTAFLSKDSQQIVASGHIKAILGVIQQRLIPSKINDAWGFELLQAVVQYIPPAQLQEYMPALIVTLLTRMQTSKTDKYVYHFVYFILYTMAIEAQGLTPDFIISTVERVQAGLWGQLYSNFLQAQAPKMVQKDRKVVFVGVTRLLTRSSFELQEPNVQRWPTTFALLATLAQEPQLQVTRTQADDDANTGITEIDYEEQTAGYQAAYSRLAASEGAAKDPVAYVTNPLDFTVQELRGLAAREPRALELMRAAAQQNSQNTHLQNFTQALAARGLTL